MLKQRIIFVITLSILFCAIFVQRNSAQKKQTQQSNRTPQATVTPSPTPISEIPATPSLTPTPQPPLTVSDKCENIYTETGLSKGFLGIGSSTFSDVTGARDEILSDATRLETIITEITNQIKVAPSQIELKKFQESASQDNESFNFFADYSNSKSKEELQKQLDTIQPTYEKRKQQKQCIQSIINKIYTPEQSFKLWMSGVFALLIGMVILGFFILAGKDEVIRRAIFSGQTGIQFLTLFSIVIAIILFGITGILQDKELAALLGGLSGYILGRYSSTPNTTPTAPPPNPPA